MLYKHCKRCGKAIPYPRTYCGPCQADVDAYRAKIQAENKRASDRRYNATRDKKYGRFYNSTDWRTLSKSRLQADGYRCKHCGKIATEVDHIQEIQTDDGWELRLEWNNLQSLCHSCHDKKHGRFRKRRERAGGETPHTFKR